MKETTESEIYRDFMECVTVIVMRCYSSDLLALNWQSQVWHVNLVTIIDESINGLQLLRDPQRYINEWSHVLRSSYKLVAPIISPIMVLAKEVLTRVGWKWFSIESQSRLNREMVDAWIS